MRKLKILCIQLGFHPDYPDVSTLASTYNDGIYYVASFLKRELQDSDVQMCQMFWGERPEEHNLASFDYILISALATHYWSNLETMEQIKQRRAPHCKLIMGGPHAAFAPYEALEYVDFVIMGEGEIPALQLIEALESDGNLEDVENLCYQDEAGRLVFNRFARYGSLDNRIHPDFLKNAPRLHWATVSMSRGCPFNCSFCYAIRLLGRRFRPKNLETIGCEVDGIYKATGCRRFYITDLNFTTRDDFCEDVARLFAGKDYHFIAMSRVEIADKPEVLNSLKASGFQEYCLGVESEDPAVLKTFNKKVDCSDQTRRLHKFAELDINTHSAIIFGLETQDRAAIARTATWCADARIMHPTFVCLAEYPFQKMLFGSQQTVEDHRIIMGVPTYQHYSFVGMFPHHMRPSQLQRCILESYNHFFTRAFEIEKRPQRRMRLKSYARSVEMGNRGMEAHIHMLEKMEAPYYTASGTLKENLLKADFEQRYGPLRERLEKTIRLDNQFEKRYAG